MQQDKSKDKTRLNVFFDMFDAVEDDISHNEKFGTLAVHEDLDENNEVVNFCKLLEQIENSFSAFEQRSEKSGEVFDEWTGVFIMYSYLRNYCAKEEVDFEKLQQAISRLHAEMKKDENSQETQIFAESAPIK